MQIITECQKVYPLWYSSSKVALEEFVQGFMQSMEGKLESCPHWKGVELRVTGWKEEGKRGTGKLQSQKNSPFLTLGYVFRLSQKDSK